MIDIGRLDALQYSSSVGTVGETEIYNKIKYKTLKNSPESLEIAWGLQPTQKAKADGA